MPRFSPPPALLFLQTLFRPHLLRPDLRVGTIGDIDYRGLRRAGFNAVVIDKDNCLTLPEDDRLYPPFRSAWKDLLAAFDPGRVLIVSNSAGTKKDPGGLAAESVTHHLRTPILSHTQPKPACASPILFYFSNPSPSIRLLSAEISDRHRKLAQEEWRDKDEFVTRFWGLAGGKIMGENRTQEGDGVRRGMGSKVEDVRQEKGEEKEGLDAARDSLVIEANSSSPSTLISDTTATSAPSEALRIIVIGDRLFTDTLLAHRLRLSLGPSNVVSIHTTTLPDPSDVRFLRWLESKLSRNKLREGREDWGRFILSKDEGVIESVKMEKGWKRFIPFRRRYMSAQEIRWRYTSWTFWGGMRGLIRVISKGGKGLGRGIRWVWGRGIAWVKARRSIKQETKEVVQEVEIATAAIKT